MLKTSLNTENQKAEVVKTKTVLNTMIIQEYTDKKQIVNIDLDALKLIIGTQRLNDMNIKQTIFSMLNSMNVDNKIDVLVDVQAFIKRTLLGIELQIICDNE